MKPPLVVPTMQVNEQRFRLPDGRMATQADVLRDLLKDVETRIRALEEKAELIRQRLALAGAFVRPE